jgi:exodeoxyribonuclease-3
MKIVTWNVNGIRARAVALEQWVGVHRPDVLCLQETKAHPDQVPVALREMRGYDSYWHGARGGYSGVSMHVRTSAGVTPAFSVPHFDEETRILQAAVRGLTILNTYIPLGQKNYRQKLLFLDSLIGYIDALQEAGERVVLCGDLNVAREQIDVHPDLYQEDMLCTRPEEREKLETLSRMGLTDVFRHHHPRERHAYSWWPYYGAARQRNVGWRIDYIWAPHDLAGTSLACVIHREESSSDHSPVMAEFRMDGPGGGAR